MSLTFKIASLAIRTAAKPIGVRKPGTHARDDLEVDNQFFPVELYQEASQRA
jgi:hypothetical protein